MPLQVQQIAEGSTAQRLGLRVGSTLVSIDGNPLHDALDYQFYTAAEHFVLTVCEDGVQRQVEVTKPEYEPFGCDFKTYLGDEKHSCDNHCMFCFIDQLPPGMREPLYFKDDDERLSFLYGNYITMTNLSDEEVERIVKMHISPIFISVHTTNPALRVRMMANKRAAETLRYLDIFAKGGIEMNCQIVLCRGINDGNELRRTLDDLLALRPQVGSIAVVPAGVTAYRDKLFKLEAYDAETAAEALAIMEEYSHRCRKTYGRSIVYPSDEWYLTAGRPIPPADFYDEFAQLEDGVGMWRRYHDTFLEELARPRRLVIPRKLDVVTGTLGGNVSVAGLVTATDIIDQCKGRLHSRVLAVPQVMLQDEGDRFLDDITLPQLGEALGCQAVSIPTDGAGCCRAYLGTRVLKAARAAQT